MAAGLGLPTTPGGDTACDVFSRVYSALVAAKLAKGNYRNVACSGATMGDLVTEQHLSGTSRDIEPQLDTAFANGTPSLIIITGGANDLYWQTYLRKCYASTCGTSFDDTVASALISALQVKTQYVLQSIGTRSHGHPPRVILTGYYQPLWAACAKQQTNTTTSEITWLNTQLTRVNSTIRSAASQYSFCPLCARQLCRSRIMYG